MSTAVYECGCSFDYNMHGARELVSLRLCETHARDPKVQQTRVCDLSQVILADLRHGSEPGHIVSWSREPMARAPA